MCRRCSFLFYAPVWPPEPYRITLWSDADARTLLPVHLPGVRADIVDRPLP